MKETTQLPYWKVILSFAAIYLVWGSTFLAALIGLRGLPPYLLISIRFLLAGLILLLFAKIKKEPNPTLQTVRAHSVSGILMLVGGTGSVVWSEQYIPTGVAAIIVAALPIWFILFDRAQWKQNFSSKLTLAGIVIGFAGIVMLFGNTGSSTGRVPDRSLQAFAVGLITIGTVSWAIGSLYSKSIRSASSTMMTVSLQLLAAGICALMVSVILGELKGFTWQQVSQSAWLAMIYMVILGSVVTYMAYVWLLTIRPAVQVGTYAYVNPLVAVLLGWAFADEQIMARQLFSLAAVISGVLLINLPKYKTGTHE